MSIGQLIAAIVERVGWLFEPVFAEDPSTSSRSSHPQSHPQGHPQDCCQPGKVGRATRVSYLTLDDGHTYVWRFTRDTHQQAIQEINAHAELGLISWNQAFELTSQIIDLETAWTAGDA